MNKEEIESLFKKYEVRIPKEKQGQSECCECKRHHKYSLTWTSFLYEYEEKYYCFEHIVNILLQQENQKYKEVIDKAIDFIKNNGAKQYNHHDNYRGKWYSPDELDTILDILKGVNND